MMLTAEQLINGKENGPKDQGPEFIEFYDLVDKKDGSTQVKVNYLKLVKLLKKMGFRRYDIGLTSFLVRITDNVVEEVASQDIVDAFEEYLNQFPENLPDGVMRDMVLNKMYQGLGTYFSSHILSRLKDEIPIVFNNHTQHSAFFYYKNGYAKITKSGVKLLPYYELENKIWKNQILQRNFKVLDAEEWESNCFVKFVKNISNNWEKRPDGKTNTPDADRYKVFKTIIGYLLHGYFEGKLKAIIFTDSRISEDPDGRTGKTLIFKAMGHMLNSNKHSQTYSELNGKDFNVTDRFKYQELSLDTRLVHLNDVNRAFSFEQLFNDITEGIKRQRKNESPVIVYAKIGISTNLTIRIHGNSAIDRSIEFEMADYYSASISPESEFKQWFFRDWDEQQWYQFDNFMMSCVSDYLGSGLLRPQAINLNIRKLQEETSLEFVKWMNDKNISHGEELVKKDSMIDFVRDHSTSGYEWLKQKTFTIWLRLYGEFHPEYRGFKERRANGSDYIQYLKEDNKAEPKKEESAPELDEELPNGW